MPSGIVKLAATPDCPSINILYSSINLRFGLTGVRWNVSADGGFGRLGIMSGMPAIEDRGPDGPFVDDVFVGPAKKAANAACCCCHADCCCSCGVN